MKNYKGIIYALLSSAAFGLSPIFAKYAYQYGSNPTSVLMFRFLFAGIMLFIYLKLKKINIKISKKQLGILMLIGVLGYTITTQTLFMSYIPLGAGLATTLHFIYPALVCVMSFFFFKEKISKTKLLSLILAGLGVYSLVAFETKSLDTLGVALALISGVAYAINIIALGLKTVTPLDNRVATMYVSFGASIGMMIYGMFSKSIILDFNIHIATAYICLSLISTIVAIILFLKAIQTIGPTSTSILATFEPIVSIIFGIIIFGESLTYSLIIGAILIIISTIILAKEK